VATEPPSRKRASFECGDCGRSWQQYFNEDSPVVCPSCESGNVRGWPTLPTDGQSEDSENVTWTDRAKKSSQAQHVVEFLTADELRAIDEDSVLDRGDFWRGSQ
jgi:hypothetical protein